MRTRGWRHPPRTPADAMRSSSLGPRELDEKYAVAAGSTGNNRTAVSFRANNFEASVASRRKKNFQKAPVDSPGGSPSSHDLSLASQAQRGLLVSVRSGAGLVEEAEEVGTPGEGDADEARSPGGKKEPKLLMGLPKLAWAMICDALAMLLVILCVPLVLTCSKRRPPGQGIFSSSTDPMYYERVITYDAPGVYEGVDWPVAPQARTY